MYGGYLVMQIGILILMPPWFNLCLYLVAWGLQIRRLHAKESLLAEDARYIEYRNELRYRLVPGIYRRLNRSDGSRFDSGKRASYRQITTWPFRARWVHARGSTTEGSEPSSN